MPIRIDNSGSPSTFSVSAAEVLQGMENFNAHYSAVSGPHYHGRDYTVPWTSFTDCITQYRATYPDVEEERIAVRFVHCYDMSTETLYMRMVLCEMQLTTITIYASQVSQVLDNSNQLWYNVKPDEITPLPVAEAQTCFDTVYLNSFEYKANEEAEEGEILAEDGGFRFVRVMTYPWKNEIWQLWHDNGEPEPNLTLLHFAAASYTEAAPGESSVLWPHGLVMYLQVGEDILLDNTNYVSIFKYKGADMATLCPPDCNSYIAPHASL